MPVVKDTTNKNQEKEFADQLGSKFIIDPEKRTQEEEIKFKNSLKAPASPVENPPEKSEDINTLRTEALNAGFTNEEFNEHYGLKDEGAGSNTHRLVKSMTDSADFLSTTLPQTVGSVITGSAAWFLSKGAGTIVGLREGMAIDDYEKGMKEGERVEKMIAENLTLAPTDPRASQTVEVLSHIIEWFTGPAREIGKIAEDVAIENPIMQAIGFDKLSPWIKYVAEFGTELLEFKMLHGAGKKAGEIADKGISKVEGKLKAKDVVPEAKPEIAVEEIGDHIIDNILRDKSPEQALIDYENIYPELAKKSAKESAEAIKKAEIAGAKEVTHEANVAEIKAMVKEPGKSAEASAKIFDTSESKIQEIEVLINEIKELAPSKLGKRGIGKTQAAIGKEVIKEIPPDTLLELKDAAEKTDKLAAINKKVNELLELKKIAEEVTGSNLNTFYNKAINEVLKDSPKEVQIEVQSVFAKEAMGKEVVDEVKKTVAERDKLLQEIDAKSERLRQKEITKQEKVRLQDEIESGKRHAKWMEKELGDIESEFLGKGEKRFITTETYLKAKSSFDQKSKRIRTGIDPEMAKDLITIGAYHIESGLRKFSEWSDLMVRQFGEKVKPHLEDIWDKSNKFYRDNLIIKAGEDISNIKRQRKFLETVKESPTTEQGLKSKVEDIKPQEYTVQPNKQSLGKANKRITADVNKAEKYVLSDAPLSAEKGATFISLIERHQKEGNYDKAVEMTEAYDLQLREAGRFVQAASLWNRLTPEGFLRWAQKEINKVNEKKGLTDKLFGKKAELTKVDKEYIMKEMDRINKMEDGAAKTNATLELIDFVAQKTPPSITEMIDAYRYQNMLSGWQTQQRNIGENTGNTFLTRPYNIVMEGTIDFVKSALTNKEREAYVSSVKDYYRDTINALPNAVDAFVAAWNMETGSFGKPDIGVKFETEFGKARARQMPKALTVVARFMEASDKFNSTLLAAGEYAVKRKAGVPHETAMADAKLLAERYLYRNKYDITKNDVSYFAKVLVGVDKMLVDSRQYPVIGKYMGWVIPFIRTPMNKGIAMIEHSPYGFARSIKSYNRETAAKAMGGSLITAIGAMYAYNGKTSWLPPTDPELKKLFYKSGRRPFSVEINGRWIPMWYLGPFALAFALPAASKYYWEDQRTALSKNWFEKSLDVGYGSARFIGSQTSTQSMGFFFNMIGGDVDYTTPHQLGFMTEQILPLSGLIRTTNKILDPVYRHPDGYIESIMKDLPILSKEIEAHTGPLGEVAEREIFNAFIPYEIGKADEVFDFLYQETLRDKQLKSKFREEHKDIEKAIRKKSLR